MEQNNELVSKLFKKRKQTHDGVLVLLRKSQQRNAESIIIM